MSVHPPSRFAPPSLDVLHSGNGATPIREGGSPSSASRACAVPVSNAVAIGTWPTKRDFRRPASLKETPMQHSHATRRFALGSIASAVVLGASLLV